MCWSPNLRCLRTQPYLEIGLLLMWLIKLKWGDTGVDWALIQYDRCSYWRRKFGHRYAQESAMWRLELCKRKPRNYQKLRERPGADPPLMPSEEAWPCQHLDSGFQPPEWWEDNCRWLKSVNMWYFVMVALGNEDSFIMKRHDQCRPIMDLAPHNEHGSDKTEGFLKSVT